MSCVLSEHIGVIFVCLFAVVCLFIVVVVAVVVLTFSR